MDFIHPIITLFQTHWVEILAVLGAVDIILGIVSKWTPFTWDDNLYSMLHNLIAKLAKK